MRPSFLARRPSGRAVPRLLASFALALGLGMSQSVTPAQANDLTVATTSSGTAIYFYGLAIAKAAKEKSNLTILPKPYRSSGQGAVFVNKGEVDFGLYNAIVLGEAFNGQEFYEGRPLKNIRMVARLVPFQLTFGASGESGITSVEDIRGQRFPSGFDATAFGDRLYTAMLATGGLTPDDVQNVQVTDWVGLGKAFVRGDIDVNGLVIGSASAKRYADQVKGYHAVSLASGPDAEARLQAHFPASRLVTVEPAEGLDGVTEPVTVMEYDYWLFAHKDTPDEAVIGLLDSLLNGQDILTGVSADFRQFDPRAMYEDLDIPFHPAALEFFAQNGMR